MQTINLKELVERINAAQQDANQKLEFANSLREKFSKNLGEEEINVLRADLDFMKAWLSAVAMSGHLTAITTSARIEGLASLAQKYGAKLDEIDRIISLGKEPIKN